MAQQREAADEYGVSTTLPAWRVGGQVRVKSTDLDKLARPIAPTAVAR